MTPKVNARTIVIPGPGGPVQAVLPRLTTKLPCGRMGHYQREADDCLTAAVATVLQVPYPSIPELRKHPNTLSTECERVARLAEWAATLGRRLRVYDRPPPGVEDFVACTQRGGPTGVRHAVAMMRGHRHDPLSGLVLPASQVIDSPNVATHVYVFEEV